MVVVDIGTLITRTPAIRGDRPRVAGTGVTVQTIVGCLQEGLTPDDIVAEFPQLTLAQVHAALAYYYANREEIDHALAEDAAVAAAFERRREQGDF